MFNPRQSKTERKRVGRKVRIQMDLELTLVIVLLVWIFWRVRTTLAMFEDMRTEDRFGHS